MTYSVLFCAHITSRNSQLRRTWHSTESGLSDMLLKTSNLLLDVKLKTAIDLWLISLCFKSPSNGRSWFFCVLSAVFKIQLYLFAFICDFLMNCLSCNSKKHSLRLQNADQLPSIKSGCRRYDLGDIFRTTIYIDSHVHSSTWSTWYSTM